MKKETIKKLLKNLFLSLVVIVPSFVFATANYSNGDIRNANQVVGNTNNQGNIEFSKKVERKGNNYQITLSVKGKNVTEDPNRDVYVAIVFDRSGSMCEDIFCSKFHSAIKGARKFEDELLKIMPDAKTALITFSDDTRVAKNFDDNTDLDDVDFGGFLGFIPYGGTNIEAALNEANILLSAKTISANAKKYIVLVGDGVPEVTGNLETDVKNTLNKAKNIKDGGVDIFAIGYGVNNDAEKVLKNIATNDSYYIKSDPEKIVTTLTNVASQLKSFEAGTNAVITDTIKVPFTFVNNSAENAIVNGNVVTCNIGDIKEDAKTCSFEVTVDNDAVKDGWYPTNDVNNEGVKLTYKDYNGTNSKKIITESAEVYCVQTKYDYTIKYYKDSINDSNYLDEINGNATLNTKIDADTTKFLPIGYKFEGSTPSITIKKNNNILNVIYVKDTFNYTINYYKDSISKDNLIHSINDEAKYQEVIEVDELLKTPTGYTYNGEEVELTIDVENNVVNIIYVKDTFNYTINYYKDSISEDNLLHSINDEAEYQEVIEVDELLKTPTGYTYNGEEVELTIDVENNVVNVIYDKDTFNYTINYYKDSISNDNLLYSINDEAKYQEVIEVDELLKTPIGYTYNGEEVELTIDVENNVVNIIYVKDTFNYTINYYKDSISENNLIDSINDEAKYQEVIEVDELLKTPTGYKYNGEEVELTIDVENNVVNIIYVKDTFNYTINYYKDSVSEDNFLGKVEESALFGKKITAVTNIFMPTGYKFEGTAPSMTIGVENNVINVIYSRDDNQTKELKYTVEYYKDNVLTESKTHKKVVWVNDSDLIEVNFDNINTTNKYVGYSFSHTVPRSIDDVVNTDTVIKVYYTINYYNYEVNYYKDSISEENLIDTIENEAKYQEVIEVDELLKTPTGYTYNGEEVELTIDVENNVVNIVYVKDTFNYTINYYKDSISENNLIDSINDEAKYQEVIEVDETLKTPTGYTYNGEEVELTIDVENNVVNIIYEKDTFNYTINYYKDSVSEDNFLGKIEETASYKSTITAATNIFMPIGYKFEGTAPSMTIGVENNVIDVIYSRDDNQTKELKYTIKFYTDGTEIEEDRIEKTKIVWINDEDMISVEAFDMSGDKYTGYKLITNPETIPASVETGRVISINYIKDESQTKELMYTIKYFKDGKEITDDEVIGFKEVWVNDSDNIEVDFDSINTTDKYVGYSFSHMNPERIGEEVKTGTIIKIYYDINYYNYEVNYYKDSIAEDNLIDSIYDEAKYQDIIEIEELLNLPEGYSYNGEEIELVIDVENNIVNIVYEKETYEYTVEYYFDGKLDEEKTEVLSALYGTEITEVEDKSYDNYILSKTENLPLIIDAEDNIIKVYYVESGIGGDIIEPPKTGNNNYLSVLLVLISLIVIKLNK